MTRDKRLHHENLVDDTSEAPEAGAVTQLKAALSGLPVQQQVDALTPEPPVQFKRRRTKRRRARKGKGRRSIDVGGIMAASGGEQIDVGGIMAADEDEQIDVGGIMATDVGGILAADGDEEIDVGGIMALRRLFERG